MLSVIIPTIWRSPYVLDLLNYLNETSIVGEIILIDNDITKSKDTSHIRKLKVIRNSKNNFVNPSWNQGVAVSSYDNLCIANDDLILPRKVLELADSFISPDINMVGLSPIVYDYIYDDINFIKEPDLITLQFTPKRLFGYGCCYFIHKDNWVDIPEDIKIQYGDDFLFYTSKKKNYILDGFKIVGKISASLLDENLEMVDRDILTPICSSDHSLFWEHIDNNVINRKPNDKWDLLKLDELKLYKEKSLGNKYL
jgi:hypothetical protein